MAARTRPRGRQSVLNPLTGRRILIGGGVFFQLMQNGFDQQGEELVRNRVVPDDAREVQLTAFEFIHPAYPDEVLLRNQLIVLRGRGVGRALNDYLFGRGRWDDTIGPFVEQQRRSNLHIVAFNVDANIPQTNVRRDPRDLDGVVEDAGQVNPVLNLDRPPLRENNPLRLPFTNIDLNAGDNNECVQRWLGYDAGHTPETIIVTADNHGDNVMLIDLFNNIMLETTDAHNKRRVKSALVYGSHVYPLTTGKYLELVHEPIRSIEEEFPDVATQETYLEMMAELLRDQHAMVYEHNGCFHISNTPDKDGIWRREAASVEDWMKELIDAAPTCKGWDQGTFEVFRTSTRDLLWARTGYPKTRGNPELESFTCVDMVRCYYRVFLSLVNNNMNGNLPLFNPSIFDEFVPVTDPTEALSFDAWYLLDKPPKNLGLQSSLVPGCTMILLNEQGGYLPTHKITFEREQTMHRHLDKLKALDLQQQKKFHVVSGIFGRIREADVTRVKLETHGPDNAEFDPFQVDWYRSKNYDVYAGQLTKRVTLTSVKNKYALYAAIVHGANYVMLRQMYAVHGALDIWPSAVKVDSLSYFTPHLTMFNRDGVVDLMVLLREETDLPAYLEWEMETAKPALTSPSPYQAWTPRRMPTRNQTFVGPPGTGKTTLVHDMHKRGEIKLDMQLCFSNKGKERLRSMLPDVPAKTLHAFFGIFQRKAGKAADLTEMKDLTIFLDEGQAASRDQWGYMAEAYHAGATFYIAMDPRQIGPVEDDVPIPIVGFMGTVTEMTTDYRNDAALQVARDMFWNRDPSFHPEILPADAVPILNTNIAYTNRTCAFVNAAKVSETHKQPGDPGKYLVNQEIKTHGLFNGMLVHINTAHQDSISMDRDDIIKYFNKRRKKNTRRRGRDTRPPNILSWGYCTTAHSAIGETYNGRMGLWGMEQDPDKYDATRLAVMYTAMTRVKRFDQLQFRAAPPHP